MGESNILAKCSNCTRLVSMVKISGPTPVVWYRCNRCRQVQRVGGKKLVLKIPSPEKCDICGKTKEEHRIPLFCGQTYTEIKV